MPAPPQHFDFARWSHYETLEIAGEWAPTMKAAKTSYKVALKKYREQPSYPVNDFECAYTAS